MKKTGIFVFIVLSVFFINGLSLAGHETDFRGEPFTDPSKIFPMPEEWVKRPIKYEDWVRKADLVIIPDQDVYHILLPVINKYAKDNNLNIVVKEGTCGIAAGALAKKTIDIGGFCCPAGKEDRLPGLKFHTIGVVAKAFLVNPQNPVDNLSMKQLTDIFRGKIYKWSEIKTSQGKPGPDWNIRPIGRFHCQARPGHWLLLLKSEDMYSPRLYGVGSIPDMISQVVHNKDAIGWEVLGMAEHYKKLGNVKPVKINGYSPTDLDAIAALKYPIYRTYQFSTWEGKGVANPHAQKLIDFLIKEVEKIDSRYGFVPVSKLKKAGWKFKGSELIGEPKH
jgi:ABC-type phosphate transport system substrate-binding protein